MRCLVVAHQVLFGDGTATAHSHDLTVQPGFFLDPVIQRCLGHKGHAGVLQGFALRAEHRAVVHRLRGWQGGVWITHDGPVDHPALDHQLRFGPEETRVPQHQVGHFADFDRAQHVADALGEGRVDGDFGHVPQDAEVVVVGAVFGQLAARGFHRVGGLHDPQPVFTDPAHGLGVAGKHRNHAHVLQHVFGCDGFRTNPAFGKRYVGRHVRVEVVTDHDHVEQLGLAVDAIGQGRVGGAWQYVALAGDLDDVRGVTATRAFGVEGVNGATFEGIDGVFDVTAFVEAVGVHRDLDVQFIGSAQRVTQGV